MTDPVKDKSDWPPVSQDARILYSSLFYSQGPVDGYLIGEKARDFFLPSGLHLPVLSQIWNLADISHDNLLTVEEFILTMHFCHGVLQGKKLPRMLTPPLKPPEKPPLALPFLTTEEKDIFTKLFEAVDVKKSGFIESTTAREIFTQTGLSSAQLAQIWDLADINRDGKLDYGEFTVACQLIKLAKQGQSLDVPINIFTNLPDRIAPGSLQAGKKRVAEYEEQKQKLMSLKERRRLQAEREKKRLELTQEKIKLVTQLYDILEKEGNSQLPELQKRLAEDRDFIEKQEEIVFRLKKEHEKVRHDTVKIILDEQKVSNDVRQIKEQTEELKKTLRSSHSKATKDPDPFHQLFEERKGHKLTEVPGVFSPFSVNIYSKSFLKKLPAQGKDIFSENNHKTASDILKNCTSVHEEFRKSLDKKIKDVNNTDALEEDQIFKTMSEPIDDKKWLGLSSIPTTSDQRMSGLLEKLQELKLHFIKLNEEGGQLVFKNPDDYFSRRAAREEEEKQEKHRQQRRASTDKRSLSGTPDSIKRRSANNTPEYKRRYDTNDHNTHKRRSYIERNDEATQAAREYRMKRRSLHLEHEREKIEESKSQVNAKLKNKSRSTELLSSKPSKRADKQPEKSAKKSPAPLPPARSHPNISSSSSSSSSQVTKKDREKPQVSQLEERANSEPFLDKTDYMNGLTVREVEVVHTRTSISEDEPLLASTPLEPRSLQSPTSPTDKSPPRPSVKKTRAPPPPAVLPINPAISNKPNFEQSTPEDSLSPASNISVDSINFAEVQKQEKLSRPARESQSLVSPSASLTPDSLSPTVTPSQSPFGSSDTLGASRNKGQNFPEINVQPKTTSQAGYLSPDSLSPTSTVSPPTSPLNPPVRPPRKKKKNASKQSASPNISTSSDSGIGKSEEKKSLNHITGDQETRESLNNSSAALSSEKTKAERPSSLIMENTTKESMVMSDQEKKNNGISPRINSEESETPVPIKRETSTKKKSPAPPPPTQNKSESGSEYTPIDSPAQNGMNISTPPCIDIKVKEDFNHTDKFSDADEQLTPRANAESPDKESSVGLKPKQMAFDRVSITSFDSVDSVPPPLPNSAPPPLPASGPPTTDILSSPDEIVEIEYTVPSHVPAVNSDQEKSGVQENHVAARDLNEDSFDSDPKIASLPVFSTMKKDNNHQETSPIEYFEGDSGIMTSLPTSPDETEARVISHKLKSSNSKHQSRDTVSSIDSQFSETNVTSPFDYESKRSLFEEKDPRAMSPTSPTSSSDGMMSPKSRKYDSKEIVEKARQFAEMVQKPNFTAKSKSQDSDEFNQETLQEFELNRRSVISESTVRKKNVSSSLETEPKLTQEAEELPVRNTEIKTTPVRHWEVKTSPEKNRAADTGWNSTSGERNGIYSQNIVQEKETTDVVDRESISESLHNTKLQWEGVFRDHIDNQFKEPKEKPKGTVRHWEVKLPNQVIPRDIIKQEDLKLSHSTNNMSEVESAIDREIRLANEREELLKREKEERLQQNGKVDISSFEKSPPSSKPLYHEMTEADRGSEMWQRETLIQQELREQEERELALKRKNLIPVVRPNQEKEASNENPNESIIQREIRLQKEREEELEKQRVKTETTVAPEPVASPSASKQEDETSANSRNVNNNSVQNDINHNEQKVNVSYEEAISGFQHEGESLIARELREVREREEEIRRQRELLQNNNNKQSKPNDEQTTPPKSASSQSIANSSSSSSISTKQGTWQKDVSPYIQKHNRSNSVDSLASSQSTGRTPSDYTPSREVKVMPNVQDDSDEERTPRYTPTTETPIQREIRLARERENELRRSKGMPEIEAPPESSPSKPPSKAEIENTPPRTYSSPRGRTDKSGHAMRSYATNRLQQELSSQRERELLYRKEGRIITTSEEHIEPMKYKEITGTDQVDGPVKRNFQRSSVSASKLPQTPEAKRPDESVQNSQQPTPSPVKAVTSPVKTVKGGSGPSFSYKESRQTAESKIERELREMREREQELRKRNNPNCEEDEPESPTDTSFTKTSILGPDGQKQSLADRWQQVCGN